MHDSWRWKNSWNYTCNQDQEWCIAHLCISVYVSDSGLTCLICLGSYLRHQKSTITYKHNIKASKIKKCIQKKKALTASSQTATQMSSLSLTQRPTSWWNSRSKLVSKSITKSVTHFLIQSAFSKLIKGPDWRTYPELRAGSWLWWQWRFRSWPGCCRQSCCRFPPCRSLRGCKPWPALTRSHRGYLQRKWQ